jgi:hypothetical protein
MGWKSFRDRLALFVVLGLPIMWLILGCTDNTLPGEALGATIVGWSLALQFYFRKKGEG